MSRVSATLLFFFLLRSIPAAASFSCNVTAAAPPVVRVEGYSELVGDVVITCTGGTPTASTQAIPAVTISVFLSTGVTSNKMVAADLSVVSEAMLLIDEPGSVANPNAGVCGSASGCTVMGTSTVAGVPGAEPFNGMRGRPNIFLGVVSATNKVDFRNVPLDQPGTGTRTLRITNIRADASALTPGALVPQSIVTSISVSPGGMLPLNNPQTIVGYVLTGLSVSPRDGANAAPLSGSGAPIAQGTTPASGSAPSAYVRFREGFSSAWKVRTSAPYAGMNASPAPANQMTLGTIYGTESGYYGAWSTAGLASSGTRLKAVFDGVATGGRVWVGAAAGTGATEARLITSEAGSFNPATATTTLGGVVVAELSVVNGRAVAVWELLSVNNAAIESLDVPVWFASGSAFGTATVAGSFAPNPSQGAVPSGGANQAQISYPVPRFRDTSVPANILNILPVSLSATPSLLLFAYQLGGSAPAPQDATVSIAGSSTPAAFTTSATSTGGWLSVSPQAGTLPARLTVTVAPSPSMQPGPQYGTVTIAVPGSANPLSISVTLTVTASGHSTASSQAISHIADGEGWKTTIILLNTDTTPANFTLNFWGENGSSWALPLGADGIRSQITGTIPVGGSRSIETDGIANALAVGWAELTSSAAVGGTAIFAFQSPGQPDSEAAVPITSGAGRRFLLPFSNAAGFGTGVAIANPSTTQAAQVSVVFRSPAGNQTGTAGPYNLPAHGHVSFVLPGSAGLEGVAEFASTADVVGLGIRGHGRAFTSVEAQADVPPGNKTISHIADGGGWKTTVILVNTDSQPAPFELRFWGDDGSALALPLAGEGVASQISGTIAPAGSRTITTEGSSSALATGWAELTTTSAVGGTAIFGALVPGQPDSEAAVPIIVATEKKLVLPFDGSSGFGTGVALANTSSQAANIQVSFRDQYGQGIGVAAYNIPARGHRGIVLPMAGAGTALFYSPEVPVSTLGIRSHNGAFTSVRTQPAK